MKKFGGIVLVFTCVALFFLLVMLRNPELVIENTIEFKDKLSEYHLYEGEMAALTPVRQANLYEIASPLFTDYAEKQRLLLLPEGKRMIPNGNKLPEFPEGTIVAKTFYYTRSIRSNLQMRHIIETRLLIRQNATWNVAVYQWNEAQNEAFLLKNGAEIGISFIDQKEIHHTTKYKIPAQLTCGTCHAQNQKIVPIGLELMNWNIEVFREGRSINQLESFAEKNLFEFHPDTNLLALADYRDKSIPIDQRARAYLDMNCAHCHNPAGSASNSNLDMQYEIPLMETGIVSKPGEIAFRVSNAGEMHMPKIGTTMQHEEGVGLIIAFIKSLNNE